MFTDGAATSATGSSPVFSSVSYTFLSSDIGAYLFIGAGTNWLVGWYKIAGVSAGNATLDAAAGHSTMLNGFLRLTAGAASTASPTGATWSIDYSQQDAAQFAYTDLVSAGSGSTVTSVAHPFGQQQVGNGLQVTAGTNFTAGVYVLASISGVTATVIGAAALTTGVGAAGVGGLGGGFATVAQAVSSYVTGTTVWLSGGSGDYTVTAAQTVTAGASSITFRGYGTMRGDGVRAVWKTSTNSTRLIQFQGTNNYVLRDIEFKNTAGTQAELWYANGSNSSNMLVYNCKFTGGTYGIRFDWQVDWTCHQLSVELCEFTGSTSTALFMCFALRMFGCYVHDNAGEGVHVSNQDIQTCAVISLCAFRANGGNAFVSNGSDRAAFLDNCAIVDNSADAIFIESNGLIQATNCILWNNGGFMVNAPGTQGYRVHLINCARGSNASGDFAANITANVPSALMDENPIQITGDPFSAASSGDFSLNSTAGAGAACKAAGIPSVMP